MVTIRSVILILLVIPCAFSAEPIKNVNLLELIAQLKNLEEKGRVPGVEKPKDESGSVKQIQERLNTLREKLYGEAGVIVETRGNVFYFLKRSVAAQIPTIENAVQHLGVASPLPFLQVDAKTFGLVSTAFEKMNGLPQERAKEIADSTVKDKHKTVIRDIINAANYLGIEMLYDAALQVYEKIILEKDIDKLATFDAVSYGTYRKAFLDPIPRVMQQIQLQKKIEGRSLFVNISADSNKIIADRRAPDPEPITDLKVTAYQVAFSPDAKTIVTTGGGTLAIWKNEKGTVLKPVARISIGQRSPLAISSDGQIIITSGTDESIKLWDSQSRPGIIFNPSPVQTLYLGKGLIESISLSRDDQVLAVIQGINEDAVLAIFKKGKDGKFLDSPFWTYKARRGDYKGVIGHELSFSPDGRFLLVGGYNARVFKLDGDLEPALYATYKRDDPFVSNVAFSPNGELLAIGHQDSGAELYRFEAGENHKALTPFACDRWLLGMTFSPNGEWLSTACTFADFWDTKSREQVGTYEGKLGTMLRYPNPEGYFYSGLKFEDGIDQASNVTFSPDSRLVAIAFKKDVLVVPVRRKLDFSKIDFAQLQAITWALKNRVLNRDDMPVFLINTLNQYAEEYIFGSSLQKKN